jgi:hypothetical protein
MKPNRKIIGVRGKLVRKIGPGRLVRRRTARDVAGLGAEILREVRTCGWMLSKADA